MEFNQTFEPAAIRRTGRDAPRGCRVILRSETFHQQLGLGHNHYECGFDSSVGYVLCYV